MANIGNRICTIFHNVSSQTDVLEKTAKFIISSIDLTCFIKIISSSAITSSLEMIKRDLKHFTQVVGILDLINQIALWTVGTFDNKGNQIDAPYFRQIKEKGWNAKLVSKVFLICGKVLDLLNNFAQWKLIDLGAISAATIGRLPYFGQALHTLATNASFPVLGVIKDSFMLATTIASSVNTLPASFEALTKYTASRHRIDDKINIWKTKQNDNEEDLWLLAREKARKHVNRIANQKQQPIRDLERSEAESQRWQTCLDSGDLNTVRAIVDYKVKKWTEVHQDNLVKAWWKKLIAAVNDVAKIVILSLSIICAVAAFAAPPVVFIALGLTCSLIGLAKTYYDNDPNNKEKSKIEYQKEYLPAV